ncbi:MAG: hypothetical protein HQK58_15770, partial [Deltaproteobacteria bacterium]|nr:hypothetical protein [Deltaproteobacteria bacterium]
VNASPRNVVNFNPISANLLFIDLDTRISYLKRAISAMPPTCFSPEIFDRTRKELEDGWPVYFWNSGLCLRLNPVSGATDVTFNNFEKLIKRLRDILTQTTHSSPKDIPTKMLTRLEAPFSRLWAYKIYLNRHLSRIEPDGLPINQIAYQELDRIRELENDVRTTFAPYIFVFHDVYDNFKKLYDQSPTALRFLFREFMELKNVSGPDRSISEIILRRLNKLQVLFRGEKNLFQDKSIFRIMAQNEFGPFIGGTISASTSQVDTLISIMGQVKGDRAYLKALTLALIFQDIGKLPENVRRYSDKEEFFHHAEIGWRVLTEESILNRYEDDPRSVALTEFLVRHHGLLGHVVKGEFSWLSLELVTEKNDRLLWDLLFIHSIITTAAIKEEILTEDTLNTFFQIYRAGVLVLEGVTDWHRMQEVRFKRLAANIPEKFIDEVGGPESVGRTVAVWERFLKISSLGHISYQDIIAHRTDTPPVYIYRKKNLKSVGKNTFEKDLYEAVRISNILRALSPQAKLLMTEYLNPQTDRVRILGFGEVARYLNYANQIKVLLLGLAAIHEKFPNRSDTWFLNFYLLRRDIPKRFEAVNEFLNDITSEDIIGRPDLVLSLFTADQGIVLEPNTEWPTLVYKYIDPINIDSYIERLQSIRELSKLRLVYQRKMRSLRKTSRFTEDYQEALEKAFEANLTRLTERLLAKARDRMTRQRSFDKLLKIYEDIKIKSAETGFSNEQMQHLRDIYDMVNDDLRDRKQAAIINQISHIHSHTDLDHYWETVKTYLAANQQYVGKEMENIVAQAFDERMDILRRERPHHKP